MIVTLPGLFSYLFFFYNVCGLAHSGPVCGFLCSDFISAIKPFALFHYNGFDNI